MEAFKGQTKNTLMRGLVWYLMYLATQGGKGFNQGTFTFDANTKTNKENKQDINIHLFTFFSNEKVGYKGQKAPYWRASSHYPGRIVKLKESKQEQNKPTSYFWSLWSMVKSAVKAAWRPLASLFNHRGLDFGDNQLPAGKRTVDFQVITGLQGTQFFVKPEDAGCDLLGSYKLDNMKETFKHGVDYLATRPERWGLVKVDKNKNEIDSSEQKEHTDKTVKKPFNALVAQVAQATINEKSKQTEYETDIVKLGNDYGIAYINVYVNCFITQYDTDFFKNKDALAATYNHAKKLNSTLHTLYTNNQLQHAKGNEVNFEAKALKSVDLASPEIRQNVTQDDFIEITRNSSWCNPRSGKWKV